MLKMSTKVSFNRVWPVICFLSCAQALVTAGMSLIVHEWFSSGVLTLSALMWASSGGTSLYAEYAKRQRKLRWDLVDASVRVTALEALLKPNSQPVKQSKKAVELESYL